MLRRTGLRDTLFIAMSNYYYENKTTYLDTLAETRRLDHDLTPFLRFGLRGVESQCKRLFAEIRYQIKRALFRNTVTDLFGRLSSPRKRVMSARHAQVLMLLLESGELPLRVLFARTAHLYALKNPSKAVIRDLMYILQLGAVHIRRAPEDGPTLVEANLDWPSEITETEFFRRVKTMPKGKTHGFLSL